MTFSRRLLASFTAAVLALAVGCAHLATPQEKEVSYRRFSSLAVAGVQLGDYLRDRTAVIIAGAKPQVLSTGDHDVVFRFRPSSRDGFDMGFASAVTSDGYFLTAAHCVPRQPVYLLKRQANQVRVESVRIVWTPPAGSPCDIAIVKINETAAAPFEWENLQQIKPQDDVVTLGPSGFAGGKVLEITPALVPATPLTPAALAVFHDAPLNYGDSGGPLVTLDGKLLGIEVLARARMLGSTQGIALQPDPQWIQHTIDADRKLQPSVH
ncbi:MAG: serine protease [Planctomycetota bacterium]|nr:serine protease [Planctomycetota bacterium]